MLGFELVEKVLELVQLVGLRTVRDVFEHSVRHFLVVAELIDVLFPIGIVLFDWLVELELSITDRLRIRLLGVGLLLVEFLESGVALSLY